jgi:hypothetical protein
MIFSFFFPPPTSLSRNPLLSSLRNGAQILDGPTLFQHPNLSLKLSGHLAKLQINQKKKMRALTKLNLGKLNHVAMAVPDLEAATSQWRDIFGADCSGKLVCCVSSQKLRS